MSPAISVRATPSQNSKRSICKFAYLFNFQTNMDSGAGLHNWKLKFGIDCMAGYFFFAKIHQRKTAFPRNRWLVAGDEQFQCHQWLFFNEKKIWLEGCLKCNDGAQCRVWTLVQTAHSCRFTFIIKKTKTWFLEILVVLIPKIGKERVPSHNNSKNILVCWK